jgi:predicted  nucleic acid-binding Zn-ribbon protein
MSENGCAFHEKLEQRVSDVEDEIVDLKTKQLLDTQKSDMLFENTMKAISDLSGAIKSLKDTNKDIQETLRGMQNEIKDSNRKADDVKEQLEKLDAKVCQIDSEGQFNIRTFLQKNFPIIIGLVMGGTGIFAWINALM